MGTSTTVTVRTLSEVRLVGFRVLCSGKEYLNEIPKVSEKLNRRVAEIKEVINPYNQIGAFMVDSPTMNEEGYWICVEVKDFKEIPDDMVSLTIPAQKYAVCKFEGPNRGILSAYKNMHVWVEDNKYERLKDTWHLEKFYSWNDSNHIDVELFETIK